MCAKRIGNGVENVYAAAAEWVDRALVDDDSLFTSGTAIWTADRLGELRRRFLDQPDESGDNFYVKLERQLAGSSPQVYQLMGEVLFVHFLIIWEPSMRSQTKKERLERVLGWGAPVGKVPGHLANGLAPGFVNLGAGRSNSLPFMVGFIINFAEQWKGFEPGERQRLLKDPWEFKEFVTQVELEGELYSESSNRHRSQMDALFYLVHPDHFEPITSSNRKTQIASAFGHLVTEPSDDVDRQLQQIRSSLEEERGSIDFFDAALRAQWDDNYQPDLWVNFINRARRYLLGGRLELEETNYKLEMGEDLAAARVALTAGQSDWLDLLKHALRSRPGHPIDYRLLGDFNRWCSESPEQAQPALLALWNGNTPSVTGLIRAFTNILPDTALRGAAGNCANVISVLLMGLDVEQYPPFRITTFEKAYDRAGYGRPPVGSDEAALYEHALDFLDRFIEEASGHGLEIPHRLDAQGIVWGILTYWDELPETVIDFTTLAKGLYLPVGFLEEIDALLEDKKQVIFQGPPGTGKTYVAQKLAARLAGSPDRADLVQLHPSYAYEDFVQGFRPTLDAGQPGFSRADGPLLRAAKRARAEPNERHFLVIDEINRGNVAKVFGELYFLLEYRDERIRLQYQDEGDDPFTLPSNLYIIGTMNTADRSIALVDLALRRRFYFVDFHPDEEPVKSVLRQWLREEAPDMDWLAGVVDLANERLRDDRHAAIGPSYFMKPGLNDEIVRRVWKHSVLPYIGERFFGDDDRLDEFDLDQLRRSRGPGSAPDGGSAAGDSDSGPSGNGEAGVP